MAPREKPIRTPARTQEGIVDATTVANSLGRRNVRKLGVHTWRPCWFSGRLGRLDTLLALTHVVTLVQPLRSQVTPPSNMAEKFRRRPCLWLVTSIIYRVSGSCTRLQTGISASRCCRLSIFKGRDVMHLTLGSISLNNAGSCDRGFQVRCRLTIARSQTVVLLPVPMLGLR
jgi:hypothetical protein